MARLQPQPQQQHGSKKLNGTVHDTQYYGCAAVDGSAAAMEEQIRVLQPDHSSGGAKAAAEKPLVKHMNLVVSVYGLTGLSMVKKGVLRRERGTLVLNFSMQHLTRCHQSGAYLTIVTTERADGAIKDKTTKKGTDKSTDKHIAYFFRCRDKEATSRLAANISTAYDTVRRGIEEYAKLVGVIPPEKRQLGTPPPQRRPPSLLAPPASPQIVRAAKLETMAEGVEPRAVQKLDSMLAELKEGQRAHSMQFGDDCFRGSTHLVDGHETQAQGPDDLHHSSLQAFYPDVVRYAKAAPSVAPQTQEYEPRVMAGLTRNASQLFLQQLGQYVVHSDVAPRA